MPRFQNTDGAKLRVAVHKFSSCDGCQLALLNLGPPLLQLAGLVDFIHFAEAGMLAPEETVDIALVEGSVTTPDELARIKTIRDNSRFLITIGACATSGGLQALRNNVDSDAWMAAVYPQPDYIETLNESQPISAHVRVDLELWGCPVGSEQVLTALRSLLFGVLPEQVHESVCLECKRQGNSCVMVTQAQPCMGPITNTGCGALCPQVGRGCYACYGPAENANADSLARRFAGFGLMPEEIARRFLYINNNATVFSEAAARVKGENGEG